MGVHSERRKLERFDLQISTKITVIEPDAHEEIRDLLTSNVCSGGAFFQTEKPLPEGTEVKIGMVLPLDKLRVLKDDVKQAYIELTGKVLRSESEGMAVSFNEDYFISPWKQSPKKKSFKGKPSA